MQVTRSCRILRLMAKEELPIIVSNPDGDAAFPLEEVSKWYNPVRLNSRRSPTRHAAAVHDAFDLIGGVPRLADWAHTNPTDFYTKLLPKTIEKSTAVEHSGEITIVSKIPRTLLDND